MYTPPSIQQLCVYIRHTIGWHCHDYLYDSSNISKSSRHIFTTHFSFKMIDYVNTYTQTHNKGFNIEDWSIRLGDFSQSGNPASHTIQNCGFTL